MARIDVEGPITDETLNALNHNLIELYNMRNVLQTQINDLVLDAGKSDQEVAQARGGHKVLADRLNEIDLQLIRKATISEMNKKASKEDLKKGLASKAEQTFVDAQFASIVSGAPKGTFSNLQALKDAYPNGEEGIFLVLSNGHWYYWNDVEKDWLDGGQYQADPWSDFMTEQNEKWVI